MSEELAKKMTDLAMRTYRTRGERAALRCALGDAAHFCDAIGRQVAQENRGRGGKGAITKRGNELEAVAKRCGDELWRMRDLIRFDDVEEEASPPLKMREPVE